MLRHAILCLRSEWTKSGEQLRRDSVPTALKSSVALTRNRRRWACELSSSSTPSQARWGVRLLAAGAPRVRHAPAAVHRALKSGKRLSGGARLTRQAEAGGTSHRHPVSGPRGCRALPPHFPQCSICAFRRICAAMASGEGWGRRRARRWVGCWVPCGKHWAPCLNLCIPVRPCPAGTPAASTPQEPRQGACQIGSSQNPY